MTPEFQKWLDELDEVAAKFDAPNLVEQTGAECWKCFFDDGYSPEDALREDWLNA